VECLELAQALAQTQSRHAALRAALAHLHRTGRIRCGEAYVVQQGLRLVQMESCQVSCDLMGVSRRLAEEAVARKDRVREGGFLALPVLAQGRPVAVLTLSLEPGQAPPECLEPLLSLALGRPGHELASRLLFAQEEERRRVGRELHDQVGSLLTAALLSLKVAEKNPTHLREAREAVQAALEEVRRLSRELRIALLDDLGVKAALERYAEEFRKRGLEVQLQLDLPPLSREQEVALFRVVQEALTNTLRHARAQRARVRVWQAEGRVFGEVEDDGLGFDPAQTPPSVGILGMQERVQALGGSLSVESAPGRGTRVSFGFPL